MARVRALPRGVLDATPPPGGDGRASRIEGREPDPKSFLSPKWNRSLVPMREENRFSSLCSFAPKMSVGAWPLRGVSHDSSLPPFLSF